MRAFQALSIFGGLLLIGSVYLLIPPVPFTASHDSTISAGGNMYLYDKLNVLRFGHLGGSFSQPQGEGLRVYVFTESEYNAFATQYVPQGLFLSDGPSSGTVSVSFPGPGNYYLVFTHGTGFENSAQSLSFSITVDGLNPVILAVGLGVLGAGAVLLVVGYRLRNKHLDQISAQASDVIMFDKPSPPPSPPQSSS